MLSKQLNLTLELLRKDYVHGSVVKIGILSPSRKGLPFAQCFPIPQPERYSAAVYNLISPDLGLVDGRAVMWAIEGKGWNLD